MTTTVKSKGKADSACVILAAGLGKRMKSKLPKVLHCLAGKPLLQHVIDVVRGAGIQRILVVVSPEYRRIKDIIGDSVEYVVQKEQLGTGHALARTKRSLGDFNGDVLVLCADVPLIRTQTIRSLMAHHRSRHQACTVLTANLEDPVDYGRIVRDRDARLVRIVEEKEATPEEKLIEEVNSGIYCLQFPQAADAVSAIQQNSATGEFPLTDVVSILSQSGAAVGAFLAPGEEEIRGINSRLSLAKAERIFQTRIAQFHMDNGVTIVDPENTYIGYDVKIGMDTRIEPFSVLEGQVQVGSNCVVGPFAHLRDGTVLEDEAEVGNFVEVKKSRVGFQSKAKHLTYLGNAEIGHRANIGAGTITANYDGKSKHQTIIGHEASIGSNTTLVAPVKVGDRAITGAGSVITKNQDIPEGAVVVGVPGKLLRKESGKKK